MVIYIYLQVIQLIFLFLFSLSFTVWSSMYHSIRSENEDSEGATKAQFSPSARLQSPSLSPELSCAEFGEGMHLVKKWSQGTESMWLPGYETVALSLYPELWRGAI